MTNYCVYCYKIMNWKKDYQAANWYKWKLAESAHGECAEMENRI